MLRLALMLVFAALVTTATESDCKKCKKPKDPVNSDGICSECEEYYAQPWYKRVSKYVWGTAALVTFGGIYVSGVGPKMLAWARGTKKEEPKGWFSGWFSSEPAKKKSWFSWKDGVEAKKPKGWFDEFSFYRNPEAQATSKSWIGRYWWKTKKALGFVPGGYWNPRPQPNGMWGKMKQSKYTMPACCGTGLLAGGLGFGAFVKKRDRDKKEAIERKHAEEKQKMLDDQEKKEKMRKEKEAAEKAKLSAQKKKDELEKAGAEKFRGGMLIGVFILLFALGIGAAMYAVTRKSDEEKDEKDSKDIEPLAELVVQDEELNVSEVIEITESQKSKPMNALQRARRMSEAIKSRRAALQAKAQSDAIRAAAQTPRAGSTRASRASLNIPGLDNKPEEQPKARNAVQRARQMSEALRKRRMQVEKSGRPMPSGKARRKAGQGQRRKSKKQPKQVKMAKKDENLEATLASTDEAPDTGSDPATRTTIASASAEVPAITTDEI